MSADPDHQMREKLLPELFDCDLTEFYENCEIFADSEEMRGILVVSDEAEPPIFSNIFLTEAQASLRTDGFLIREDPSLKTFWNFFVGRDYLNSRWTAQAASAAAAAHHLSGGGIEGPASRRGRSAAA